MRVSSGAWAVEAMPFMLATVTRTNVHLANVQPAARLVCFVAAAEEAVHRISKGRSCPAKGSTALRIATNYRLRSHYHEVQPLARHSAH